MTYGKRTCKILKEIRRQIADKNDIEYVTSECHYQGECQGTCPKCEAELQYLESELSKRRQLGKAVAVAGISLGIAGGLSSYKTPQQAMFEDTIVEKSVVYASVYAQIQAEGTGTIKGKVVVNDSNTPLEFATVRLMQNGRFILGQYTDSSGFFTLDSIPEGFYDLHIAHGDYPFYAVSGIEIEKNTIKDIGEIQLEPIITLTMGLVLKGDISKKDAFKKNRKSNKKTKHNKSTN